MQTRRTTSGTILTRGNVRPGASGGSAGKSARRPLSPDVLQLLERDERFQVMSLDQQFWLDPYTAQAVPAPLGRLLSARDYLVETGVWRDRDPLPQVQLNYERWRFDLVRLVPNEPRLRIFSRDGRGWLNPWTGNLTTEVERDDGKVTPRTFKQMARHLANCPEAQKGPMLDQQTLLARGQSLGLISKGSGTTSSTIRKATDGDPANLTSGANPVVSPSGSRPAAVNDDLQRARTVQQHMLNRLPSVPGYELAVHYSAHAGVSGDFYECLSLSDGRVLMVLGDVSGHGMQAALVVASALKTLRFIARTTNDLIPLVTRFNEELRQDLLPGQFMTITAGIFDPEDHTYACLRAGHHHALLVHPAGPVLLRHVGQRGMAIGLASGERFAATLVVETVELTPGDVLVQYTDGLIEAQDGEQHEFGEHRLCASIFSHLEQPAQVFVDAIARDASAHAGGALGDDLSILALARLPEAEEPAGSESATDLPPA